MENLQDTLSEISKMKTVPLICFHSYRKRKWEPSPYVHIYAVVAPEQETWKHRLNHKKLPSFLLAKQASNREQFHMGQPRSSSDCLWGGPLGDWRTEMWETSG